MLVALCRQDIRLILPTFQLFVNRTRACAIFKRLFRYDTKRIGVLTPRVVDPYSFFTDPDPEVDFGDQYGSRALKVVTNEKGEAVGEVLTIIC